MQALAQIDRALMVVDAAAGLEDLLARDLGRGTVLTTRSPAAAGPLATAALGLAPGDEVVVAPGTGRGLIAAVLGAGARPVFADVDARHGCLTAATVAAALTPDSRAVLIRHADGAMAPMESLTDFARRHGLSTMVDETEAFPASTRGADLSFSRCTVSTDDDRLGQRLRRLRDGQRGGLGAAEIAALRNRIRTLATDLVVRREAAARLSRALESLPGLTLPADLERHALAALPLIIDPARLGVGNRTYAAALADAGIAVRMRWSEQPLYRLPGRLPGRRLDRLPVYGPGHCPVAEDRIGRTVVLLDWSPTGPADVERTAVTIAGVHDGFLRRHADRTRG